ncbi:DJ-1/PfpI family protein [Paenibacillus massiliensis]|uniref:DJ-1/PfpI family protein n=1 Tax=Paenibacillus massiliensis TaxID=225917 RepID=UPI0003787203|nr:DJ-1/PfpI family protein [Paenibacillus massiliensis]
MKFALVLFDGVTFLDFIGFYDVITKLRYFDITRDATFDICALHTEVRDELGLTIKIDNVNPDLSDYDAVFIPGGMGTRQLRYDEEFVTWLRKAEHAQYLISVCTGSLLLGAAGLLQDIKATTHPLQYALLEPYVSEVLQARIVQDGRVITAGGVSTSIDLGLYMIELLLGMEAKEQVKRGIDYPYETQGVVVEEA